MLTNHFNTNKQKLKVKFSLSNDVFLRNETAVRKNKIKINPSMPYTPVKGHIYLKKFAAVFSTFV